MRLNFYLLDLVGASCLNIFETVAVKMRRDMSENMSNLTISEIQDIAVSEAL